MMNRSAGTSNTYSPTHPGHPVRALLPLALVICALAGCQAQKTSNRVDAGEYITVEAMDRLKQELKEFGDYFDSAVDRAAMEIERKSTSREVRR